MIVSRAALGTAFFKQFLDRIPSELEDLREGLSDCCLRTPPIGDRFTFASH